MHVRHVLSSSSTHYGKNLTNKLKKGTVVNVSTVRDYQEGSEMVMRTRLRIFVN